MTSPFVFLDRRALLGAMALEREHMALGHFGMPGGPAAGYYFVELGSRILGWPALAAGLGALVVSVVRRDARALLAAAFLVPYFAAIGSWTMKADRYLLPTLPFLMISAGAAVAALRRHYGLIAGKARFAIPAGLAVLLAVPVLGGYRVILDRNRMSTRTLAGRWIEENVPAGSLILMEGYGPNLLRPLDLQPLESDLRERLVNGGRPIYPVQLLPMFQVEPARSSIYYRTSVNPEADYILTTSDVRGRYEQDPMTFAPQVAYYRELDARFEKVMSWERDGFHGPEIILYRSPAHTVAFCRRASVSMPVDLEKLERRMSAEEGFWYYNLGLNYMNCHHPDEALACYYKGYVYDTMRPEVFGNLVIEIDRNLRGRGFREDRLIFLDEAMGRAPTESIRRLIAQLRRN